MTNVNWKNDISGSWNTASDWSDNVVPDSPADDVTLETFATAYTVTYSGLNDTIGFLDVQKGATLSITSGTLTVSNGTATIYNTGAIDVASGATLALSGGWAEINGTGSLALAGTLELEADSYPELFSGKAALVGGSIIGSSAQTYQLISTDDVISGYGTIGNGYAVSKGGSGQTNSPGLVFQNSNGAVVDASGSTGYVLTLDTGANWIENAGLIESTGAGGLIIDSNMWQDGTLLATGSAGITIDMGVQVGGLGEIEVLDGSKITLNDGAIVSTDMYIGTLAAPGGLISTTVGNAGASADTLRVDTYNDGEVEVANNSTLMFNSLFVNYNQGSLVLDATTRDAVLQLFNTGANIVGGLVSLTNSVNNEIIASGNYLQLSNYSTIAGSGVIGDGYLRLYNSTNGVIDADGTAGLTIKDDNLGYEQDTSTNFTNYSAGLIEATSAGSAASAIGLLTFKTGVFGNAGEILAGAKGKVVLDGTLVSSGGGQIDVASGGQLLLEDGAVISGQAGIWVAAGGTLSTAANSPTYEIETSIFNSGTVDFVGGTTLDTDKTWYNLGKISIGASGAKGGATVVVVAGQTLRQTYGGTIDLYNVEDTIVSSGAGAYFENRQGMVVGEGSIGDANLTIQNALGGTIEATGDLSLGYSSSAPGIENGGLLEATGGGVLTLLSYVNDTGNILVTKGSSIIAEQNVGNDGQVNLDGGTLEFEESFYAQTHFDSGVTSSLILNNPNDGDAGIYGFTTGDTIDLTNFKFGNGTFHLLNTMGALDGSLQLQNSLGDQSAGIELDGDYMSSAGTFSFTKDKFDGTVIHWTAKN